MQYLILPFKRQMMLCGYKNVEYLKSWGYNHFGIDISAYQADKTGNLTVYASGEGTVLAAGKDSALGYGLAILYPDCYNHKTGKTQSLTARYMHLAAISVKKGDKVKPGQPIAVEGKEGTVGVDNYHLHLEFDTDTTPAYATWSPQIKKGRVSFWRNGVDSTVNPSFVLYKGADQILVPPKFNQSWLNAEDKQFPAAPKEETDYKTLYEKEKEARQSLQDKHNALIAGIENLIAQYQ